jgi:hypothetical protein
VEENLLSLFLLNGKGYFGLGYDDPSRLNPEGADFWEYDPATDGWTQKHDVPFVSREAAVVLNILRLLQSQDQVL